MAFPNSLDDLDATRGTALQALNSPSHVTHHTNEDTLIEAIQTKLGIDSSAVATSIDYLLKNTSSSNPGHKHTLANGATDVTATAAELNYVGGVTSAIQTQMNLKAPLASPTFTGTATFGSGVLVATSPIIRAWDGWNDANETWTYASVDAPTGVITVPTDATTKYSVGMKVKFTQTTVKYGIITAIAATSMTIYTGTDYTLANAAITANYYSSDKAPLGFPLAPDKWTVETVSSTDRLTTTATQNTWYNAENIVIPIGVWRTEYIAEAYSSNGSAVTVQCSLTLSTANNSATDSQMTGEVYSGVAANNAVDGVINRAKILTLATKTTYYLNYRSTLASQSSTGILGTSASSVTLIRAICAYL